MINNEICCFQQELRKPAGVTLHGCVGTISLQLPLRVDFAAYIG